MMKHTWIACLVLVPGVKCSFGQKVQCWKTLPGIPPTLKPDSSVLVPVNGVRLYFAVSNMAGHDLTNDTKR